MAKKFNYRKYYKEYYGIDFGSEYVIHHIDFDRSNNDIRNLILLPKKLHRQYHFILTALGAENGIIENFNLRMDGKTNQPITEYQIKMFVDLLDVLKELRKWKQYKNNLEYNLYMEQMIAQ